MFKVPNMDGEFLSVGIDTGEETPVKQYFKDECDINNILKNYNATGQLNHLNLSEGDYIDLPDALDLQSSLEMVRQAENAFADLPSGVREHFKNDPVNFLNAVHDTSEEGLALLRKLNLVTTPEGPPPAAPQEQAGKAVPTPASGPAAGASGTGV